MLRNLAGATPVLTSGNTPPITDPAVVQEADRDVVSALPDCGQREFCPLGMWQEPQLTATLVTGLSNGEPLHYGSSTMSQLQSHRDPGGTHQSRSPARQGLYLPETASSRQEQVFVPSNTRTSTQVYTDQ